MILNNALYVVEKQKEFTSSAVEKFASAFTQQVTKLVQVVKAREKKQKTIPTQLPTPLNGPKLRSFFNKNRASER